jgi:hypothetical protein
MTRTGRGTWWPWAIAALLALMALMMGTLVWLAARDPTHVVESEYYHKAVDWDRTVAQRAASARLGWSTRLDFLPVPAGMAAPVGAPAPNTLVVAALADSAGRPLAGLRVHLRAFFSARADRIYQSDLQPVAGGYGAAFRLGPPGLWVFELEARRDSLLFLWSGTRDLGAAK